MSDNDLPQHIGIILDGNRRWAKRQGLKVFDGHKKGAEVLEEIVVHGLEIGIKYTSVYVFSTENWSRAADEVNYLMNLLVSLFTKKIDRIMEKGGRVVFVGDLDDEKISPKVKKVIAETVERTKDNAAGTIAICFNYGGQLEIVDAVKKIVNQGIDAEDITPETISDNLYSPELPPIDLVIRTSGEQRLSNFMLWRTVYSEFVFVDKDWPDFIPADLDAAVEVYQNRHRRFGGN